MLHVIHRASEISVTGFILSKGGGLVLGGPVAVVLANGPKVRGVKPGRG